MDHFVAVDLGAGSGRVMLASLADGKLQLEEMHRFDNPPLRENGTLRWDTDKFLREITLGLKRVAERGIRPISISCDTWGVDYGWFNAEGKLIEYPHMYRDTRTQEVMPRLCEKLTREKIFSETGIQFMPFNTIYQLAADQEQKPALCAPDHRFLMIGDLLAHLLGANPVVEESMASTSQLFDPTRMDWAWPLVEQMGLPRSAFPKVVPSGTKIGKLRPDLAAELNFGDPDLVATCTHDTGAAVAAVPAEGDDWAYLSCGTWSLIGVELPRPLINDSVRAENFTNEVGYGSSIRFLKNVVGLWLIQESRREWNARGMNLSYDAIDRLAEKATPFQAWVNPDEAAFQLPDGMPEKIVARLRETGQPAPEDPGAIWRIILESLAFKYRQVLEKIERLTGRPIRRLHMVGGGIRTEMLCQFTANAIRRPVYAGPIEATAIGNSLIQAIVAGRISDHAHLRSVVRDSFPPRVYEPQSAPEWDAAWEKWKGLYDGK